MNSEIDKALGVVEDIEINPIVEKKVNPIQISNNDADIENDYAYQRHAYKISAPKFRWGSSSICRFPAGKAALCPGVRSRNDPLPGST